MNVRRWVVGSLLALGAAGLLYTFRRMEGESFRVGVASNALPRYTLSGAELMRYDDEGEPALRGQAETIEYFDDQSGRAENVLLDVLSGDSAPWRISSPLATLPAHQRRFLLQAPVVIDGRWPDNGQAMSAQTDRLSVDPDTQEFAGDGPVILQSNGRNGTAVGLRGDWQDKDLRLLHDVKLSYEAPPS